MKERINTFNILSFAFGFIAVFSITTVVIPLFCGSLAIIFAILSKEGSLKMNVLTKWAAIISSLSIVLSCIIAGNTAYLLATDEEYRSKVNSAFEELYGVTMEEYMDILEQTYETGEVPEEWVEQLEQMGY